MNRKLKEKPDGEVRRDDRITSKTADGRRSIASKHEPESKRARHAKGGDEAAVHEGRKDEGDRSKRASDVGRLVDRERVERDVKSPAREGSRKANVKPRSGVVLRTQLGHQQDSVLNRVRNNSNSPRRSW